jgi:NhaP-type Na+/H+ or K+/H+ antiporter
VIPSGILIAFVMGLLLEAFFLWWSDRRAIRREADFWEQLRANALDGYGRVFDWAELEEPKP